MFLKGKTVVQSEIRVYESTDLQDAIEIKKLLDQGWKIHNSKRVNGKFVWTIKREETDSEIYDETSDA